jgi:hypothetical protein
MIKETMTFYDVILSGVRMSEHRGDAANLNGVEGSFEIWLTVNLKRFFASFVLPPVG